MKSTSNDGSSVRRLPRLASFSSHMLLDGHGKVASSSQERRDMHPYFGTWPYNVGDQFVGLAIARLLNFEEFFSIDHGASQRDFDLINSECDIFVIRGSNFIYPGFFATKMTINLLRKIKIPIVYIGAGIQYPLGEKPYLLREDIDSLKYIHDSCVSCSVRGHRAAELLNKWGIQNVRVTGCPTIVYGLKPSIQVQKPSWDHVGWTVTDMNTKPDLKRGQFAWMKQLQDKAGKFSVIVQGGEVVLQEYIFARDGIAMDRRIDTAVSPTLLKCRREVKSVEKLAKSVAYYYRDAAPQVVQAMLDNSFFSNSIPEYRRFLRTLSVIFGTRLHGNLMGLSQGKPTVFAFHDERLKDMCELMKVPTVNLMDAQDNIELDQFDWAPFERAYQEIHAGFISFLDENDLAHNLTKVSEPTAEPLTINATAINSN